MRIPVVVILGAVVTWLAAPLAQQPLPSRTLMSVVLDVSASSTPLSGRLLLLMTKGPNPLDSATPGFSARDGQWVAAQDVAQWRPGEAVYFDVDANAYPQPLSTAPRDEYHLVAWLDVDRNAAYTLLSPGDVRSVTQRATGVRPESGALQLRLTARIPEQPISLTDGHELVEFVSPKLSAFWGRPITMRAIVTLPPGYKESSATYPTVFWTHGFGTTIGRIGQHRRTLDGMVAGQRPPMIWVFLEQAFPSGTHEFATR